MAEPTLSISLSRDTLGLAIFQGQRLVHLEAYSLQSVPKAPETSAGYVLRCIESFNPGMAVLQEPEDEPPDVRKAVLEALRAASRPVYEISSREVLTSFGDPPVENKEELRQIVRILFPQVPSNRLAVSCLDAVAAGLYFETSRLLNKESG